MSPTPTYKLKQTEHGLFQLWIWCMTLMTQILTCPTTRCSSSRVQIFSNHSTCVTFPQAGATPWKMFTVSNRCQIRNCSIGCTTITASRCILKVYLQFLGFKKLFIWLRHKLEKLWMNSAKRLDVLSSNNDENFLVPHINMKRLQDKNLVILWHEKTKYISTTRRVRQLERGAVILKTLARNSEVIFWSWNRRICKQFFPLKLTDKIQFKRGWDSTERHRTGEIFQTGQLAVCKAESDLRRASQSKSPEDRRSQRTRSWSWCRSSTRFWSLMRDNMYRSDGRFYRHFWITLVPRSKKTNWTQR